VIYTSTMHVAQVPPPPQFSKARDWKIDMGKSHQDIEKHRI
jgi:hypothetical protein